MESIVSEVDSARSLYLLSTSITRNNSHNTYFLKAITAVGVYLSNLTVLEVLWERTGNKSETCKTIDLLELVCLLRYFYLLVKYCIPLQIPQFFFHGALQRYIGIYIKLPNKARRSAYRASAKVLFILAAKSH